MPKPKPTLLDRRLTWFKNHQLFGAVILVTMIITGVGAFTDSITKISSFISRNQTPKTEEPIMLTVRVTNSTDKPRTIESFSQYSLVTSDVAMMRILSEGRVELVPTTSTTESFTIPSRRSRDFTVTMPHFAGYYQILEFGGANLYIAIRPTDTSKVALASAIFQRAALKRYFVPVDLAEAQATTDQTSAQTPNQVLVTTPVSGADSPKQSSSAQAQTGADASSTSGNVNTSGTSNTVVTGAGNNTATGNIHSSGEGSTNVSVSQTAGSSASGIGTLVINQQQREISVLAERYS